MTETEIYQQPFLGHKITIKRGAFLGWVGMVYYPKSGAVRKKVKATTRDDVKSQLAEKSINRQYCHDCKKHSWFVCFFTPWHGWDVTCLRCGREWADGEWIALPFMRGARKRNIDSAKRRYRKAQETTCNENL